MSISIKEHIDRIVQQKETELYNDIIYEYQAQIFSYCYRILGNKHDAEDAAQEVFYKGYNKLPTYKNHVSFSAWLYKIAYHHCLNKIRKRQVYDRIKNLIPFQEIVESAEDIIDGELFSENLSKAMDKLSYDERNLLVLRIFEEKSYDEIGMILGMKPETIKKRYFRTKNKLKSHLSEGEEAKYDQAVSIQR